MVSYAGYGHFSTQFSVSAQLGGYDHTSLPIQLYLAGTRINAPLKVAQFITGLPRRQLGRFLLPALHSLPYSGMLHSLLSTSIQTHHYSPLFPTRIITDNMRNMKGGYPPISL